MIDINELRRLTQAALAGPDGISLNWVKLLQDFQQKASPTTISELLDRLEAAEKDAALKERVIDALGSELNAVANERDALRAEVNVWRRQAEGYWAKIEAMEKQEPVAWIRGRDNHRRRKLSFEKPVKSSPDKLHWSPLYALPGAQGEEK